VHKENYKIVPVTNLNKYLHYGHVELNNMHIDLLLLLFTAIELAVVLNTSTDKPNKNKYIDVTIKKHGAKNTKRNKYKYTYYQNAPGANNGCKKL
jgi:hypothetical protein